MTWREYAAPIIKKVLEETEGKSEKEIKQALFDAYPFGERHRYPYKIWLDEIKKQRNPQPQYRQRKKKQTEMPKEQMKLL